MPDLPNAPMPRLMAPHLIEDQFLKPAEHAALLEWAIDSEMRFAPATLGGGLVDPAVRRAFSLRDLGPIAPLFRARMLAEVPRLIQALRVTPFVVSDVELELAAHNHGAHFVFHADTYTGTVQSLRGDRMLSAVYYFHREPRAFFGGDLTIHRFGAKDGDNGTDIAPAQNRLVVFPSWVAHEVRAVSVPSGAFADSRFAVNCWIYRARIKPPAG